MYGIVYMRAHVPKSVLVGWAMQRGATREVAWQLANTADKNVRQFKMLLWQQEQGCFSTAGSHGDGTPHVVFDTNAILHNYDCKLDPSRFPLGYLEKNSDYAPSLENMAEFYGAAAHVDATDRFGEGPTTQDVVALASRQHLADKSGR